MNDPNPINMRDLILDEPNGFVVDSAIRCLVARGWPANAIMAEIPGVSDGDVRRALEAREQAA